MPEQEGAKLEGCELITPSAVKPELLAVFINC